MSKSSPFFSIIIPTFNRADLLPKAIESVIAQDFNNWELIVVDDGSTDNTAGVVRGYKDERIRYVYQTNAERSAARNNGIDLSRAKYICFLDSDDYYLPGRLKLIYNELFKLNCPVAMFYTNYVIDKGGEIYPSAVKYQTTGTVFNNIILNVIHSQQTCISNEILKEFKYDPRFRIGEDLELWLRLAHNYQIIYLEEQNTMAVVDHEYRSVNVMRYNTGAEQLRLYNYIFQDQHSGKNLTKELKSFLISRAYQAIAKYNIYQQNRAAAIFAIIRSISADRHSVLLKFRLNIFIKLITFYPMDKLKELVYY